MNHTTPPRAFAALVAVAGLAAATLAVSAQTPPGDRPAPRRCAARSRNARHARREADFVRTFDSANTAELDAAKYVVNRTKNPECTSSRST